MSRQRKCESRNFLLLAEYLFEVHEWINTQAKDMHFLVVFECYRVDVIDGMISLVSGVSTCHLTVKLSMIENFSRVRYCNLFKWGFTWLIKFWFLEFLLLNKELLCQIIYSLFCLMPLLINIDNRQVLQNIYLCKIVMKKFGEKKNDVLRFSVRSLVVTHSNCRDDSNTQHLLVVSRFLAKK